MKTNKTPATKTPNTPRTSTRATPAAKKSTATTAPKKKPSAAKSPVPLTSPRVTKAAANAKRALTLTPEVTKSTKPAVAKKPKPVAKPKSVTSDELTTAARTIKEPAARTTIEAFIDVGFGNRLTLRGEGAAGLSWERGLTMNCLGNAEWGITLEGSAEAPLAFKFLLNDELWSTGENYTLAPGKTGAFSPEF